MTRKELLNALRESGVSRNKVGPIEKEPTPVLEGMLEKIRTDQRARESGAGPCALHEDQVAGVCPYCRGLWRPAGGDA